MPKIFLSTFIFAILVAFVACTPPTAPKEKTAPKPEPKKEVPTNPTTQKKEVELPPGAMVLRGDITFVGRKVIGSHDFVFKKWTGYAQLKDEKIAGGSIRFQIETASVVADEGNRSKWTPKLEAHMKDPDFFHVEKFPTATFSSSNIAAETTNSANTYRISGTLNIKGISKEVTFPAVITMENGKPNASAEITINRQDFGIKYPGKPDNLIQDNVVITIKAKG